MENKALRKRYSFEEIKQLRSAGVAKPKDTTWSEWNSPYELSSVQESMCYRSATGLTVKRISEEMELSYSHVSTTLNSEICKFRVKELQFQIFGKNPQKRFGSLVESSIGVVQKLMEDESEKGLTRLKAANIVLDRAMGKPTQMVEVRDSSIKDIYNKLDELFDKEKKTVEVEHIEEVDYSEIEEIEDKEKMNNIEIEDVEIETEQDEVDKWMEKNYG